MTKKRQYIYQSTATGNHRLAVILAATANAMPGMIRNNYRLISLDTVVTENDGQYEATVTQKYGYAPEKRNTKL